MVVQVHIVSINLTRPLTLEQIQIKYNLNELTFMFI